MPGLMINATCNCGYDITLSPGATLIDLFVMAYSEDGKNLITVKESVAVEKKLKTISDPFVEEKIIIGGPEELKNYLEELGQPLRGYDCPKCKTGNLELHEIGSWD